MPGQDSAINSTHPTMQPLGLKSGAISAQRLSVASICSRSLSPLITASSHPSPSPRNCRSFATTPSQRSWLIPKREIEFKDPKGRPRVPTGGSTRGTTVIWGDYGLRLKDQGRRISAANLKIGEECIRRRLRGVNYRLFSRISASVAVFTKGNDHRMGTGKGKFDYWAARVGVSRVVFEISGDCHEQVMRDALRLAANKLPGTCF